ncbi:UPF0481 protein [Camellia lanceoleosa]|uniref:UPF0481 protein n=1 Tax=Camellia lanceoleosa TaxID=1840588 RepID=A0ACC0G9U8_9ERIC|nr:UPF0481 protein [Camellia lanceoleosa]
MLLRKIGLDKYELAEILLADGCFLLELFLRYSGVENEDTLINNAQTIATLQRDLALLENQIPFFVLETLFDIIKDHMPQPLRCSFTEHNVATLVLLFFKSTLSLRDEAIRSKSSKLSGRHLVDILHKFYQPKCETLDIFELHISDKILESRDLQRSGLRDCATILSKAGTHFAANTEDANENLLDIKFDATNKVVTMRPFHIQEAITETIFRNLIAFEQCDRIDSTSHHIASYVFLMRSLLHSSYDVGILQEKGIIKNQFGESGGGGGGGGEDVINLAELRISDDPKKLLALLAAFIALFTNHSKGDVSSGSAGQDPPNKILTDVALLLGLSAATTANGDATLLSMVPLNIVEHCKKTKMRKNTKKMGIGKDEKFHRQLSMGNPNICEDSLAILHQSAEHPTVKVAFDSVRETLQPILLQKVTRIRRDELTV